MFERRYIVIIQLCCFYASIVQPAEKPTGPQETCVTEECHADYNEKSHVHAPVELGECDSCHKPLDLEEHTYQFIREGKDLCEYCHLDQTTKKNIHEPLETGDCMQCHDPHSSDNSDLLIESSIALNCKKCHDTTSGLEFLHGPTAIGECSICHETHSSDNDSLLVSEHSELCFSCHIITQDELKKFEFVHEPVESDCIGCHDPHGADNLKMVKSSIPTLCYNTCHEDIQIIAEDSPYQHSAVTDEGGCTHCHTPHASTVQYLLTKDATDLCMTCHNEPMKLADAEILPALSEEINGKKYMHGPVADNDCSGCHVAHGSQYFRLLAKNYPPVFYAPFSKENYELCFSCHEESLIEVPTTIELTDFRNGDLNLHYLHVNKEIRGRTCRACHDTHASDIPKIMRESVPYGMWQLPVGFAKTETGGSCNSGCHLLKAYDRKKPLDYSSPSLILVNEKETKNEI